MTLLDQITFLIRRTHLLLQLQKKNEENWKIIKSLPNKIWLILWRKQASVLIPTLNKKCICHKNNTMKIPINESTSAHT